MGRPTAKILLVVGAVVVTAWFSTFALIWLGVSALPGASVRINPLLPHRATISVRYVENGNTITGLLKFKGLNCDSYEWWNNGNWAGSGGSGLSSFTGPDHSGVPSVSFSFSSSNFHSVQEWYFGGKSILREQQTGIEPFLHGVLPQLAGYVALMVAWRRRMEEPSEEALTRKRTIKIHLLCAYALGFLALISAATYAYCSFADVKLPILENSLVVIWLGMVLFSLTSVLRVIRGGLLSFSLFTLPLWLGFSGVVTFWLINVGIL
jgi:hypothetical protein